MKEETKEKAKTFMEKAKKLFDRGIVASKKALGVAGEAVQDFSDKSVVTIEKKQLESKIKKQQAELGEYAAGVLAKKGAKLTADDAKVAAILKEIARLNKEIKARDEVLDEASANKAAAKKTTASKATAKKTASKAAVKSTAKPAAKTAKAPAKKSTSKTASKTTSKKSEKK